MNDETKCVCGHIERQHRCNGIECGVVACDDPRGSRCKCKVFKHAKPTEFPPADFYDCADSERLQHTSPEEAVEYFVDSFFTRDCDVAKTLQEIGEVTVGCYRRGVIPEKHKEFLVDRMLDLLDEEHAGSEYVDPDGTVQSKVALDAARPHARAAVEAFLAAGDPVWACDRFQEVVLTPEQVEAMMREHCPDWFDP